MATVQSESDPIISIGSNVLKRESIWTTPLWLERIRESRNTIIIVSALTLFSDMLVYGIIIPILPSLIAKRTGNQSESLVGYMIGTYATGLLVVTPFVSLISDRYRIRKLPLLLGPFLLLLATCAFSMGNSLTLLFLGRIGQGIGGGISWTLGFTMLADIFAPSELGIPMGKVFSANTFGFLIGPPVGGLIFDWLGEEWLFGLCGIIVLLTFFTALVFVPDTLAMQKERDDNDQEKAPLLSCQAHDNDDIIEDDTRHSALAEPEMSPEVEEEWSKLIAADTFKLPRAGTSYGSCSRSNSFGRFNNHGRSRTMSGTSSVYRDDLTLMNEELGKLNIHNSVADATSDRSRLSPGVCDWETECDSSSGDETPLFDELSSPLTKTNTKKRVFSSSQEDSTSIEQTSCSLATASNILEMMADWEVTCTALAVVLCATVFTCLEPVLPIYLARNFNASPSEIGIMWSAMMVPNLFFSQWAGEWSDKYGRKNISALGLFIFALSCPLVALAPTRLLCVLALAGIGIGQAIAMTPSLPEMAEFVQAKGGGRLYAQMYALFNVADALGMWIGPMVGGLLFQTGGIQLVTFSSCGVLTVTGLMVGITYISGIQRQRRSILL